MPSGWNVYYAVFLSAVLGLGIPSVLLLASRVLRNGPARSGSDPIPQNNAANHRSVLGERINVRYFLATNVAILLLALALLLIPCVTALGTPEVGAEVDRGLAFRGLLAIFGVATLCGLGLFYAFKKGDLDWLKTFRSKP